MTQRETETSHPTSLESDNQIVWKLSQGQLRLDLCCIAIYVHSSVLSAKSSSHEQHKIWVSQNPGKVLHSRQMRKHLSTTRDATSTDFQIKWIKSCCLQSLPQEKSLPFFSLQTQRNDSDGFPAGLVSKLQIQPLHRRQTYSTSLIITGQLLEEVGKVNLYYSSANIKNSYHAGFWKDN